MEGSGSGLIVVLSWNLRGVTEENHQNILTERLQRASLKGYRHANPPGVDTFRSEEDEFVI
jgi:hypothetical protein